MARRLMWGAGAVLGLVAVAALVVPLLVRGDVLRELVIESVTEATGARVELGEARVRILPRPAVRLAGGRIAGTGPALDERTGTASGIEAYAAEIDLVELDMALGPLLRREIAVTSVRVVVPRLAVTLPDDRIEVTGAVLRVRDLVFTAPGGAPPVGAPPGAAIPADLVCRADLRADRVSAGGGDYDRVRADARLAGRVIEVRSVTAERGGGELSGSATLDYAADPWGRLEFAFEARGVPAGDLLEPFAPDIAERLAADLEAAGRGGCDLRDGDTALATLDLEGTMTAGAGVLHAGDWLEEALPYLGERRDLVDVRFRRLDHRFAVVGGRYLVEDLEIDGLDTTWRGAGWVGLDDAIGLGLSVQLPPGFTPDLGTWSFLAATLRDEDGRVRLDLTLTGRASRPKVGLDLRNLKAKAR